VLTYYVVNMMLLGQFEQAAVKIKKTFLPMCTGDLDQLSNLFHGNMWRFLAICHFQELI
jgi:hypothetical protein